MFKTTAIAAVLAVAFGGSAFAQGNSGNAGNSGNNSQQEGLVNVSTGSIAENLASDLDVNVSQIPVTVQVPVGIAANVCNVSAAVLAQQAADAEPCEATTATQGFAQAIQRQLSSQ